MLVSTVQVNQGRKNHSNDNMPMTQLNFNNF